MAFKFKGSLSAVDASLKGGVIFDNEKLSDSKIMPKGKFTINEIDESTTDLASNTLVTNFGKQENIAGMFSFNTGDWKDTASAPVKLMMRVVNDVNDSDWVTIFDSSKTTVTWSSIAIAGQTKFTVPNLDFKKAIIYVNGVLQYPGLSYQTFGGTVTFNSKLSTGDTIYVVVGEDTTNTDNEEFTATATEDQTVIVLPFTKKTNFVFINGILQYPDSYTVSGSTITLGDKLYLNDDILVLGNETDLVSFTALASQNQTDFTLPGEFDDGLVYINGVLQYDNAYSVSGTTLSFISSLDENDNVFVTLNDPKFIDSVNASYTSTITDESNNKLNIPYFNFSELQVFINGVLQNPDSGAYILNGTEVTLSSPLQLGDDIHVIVYNSPVQNSNLVTKADLSSYATQEELDYLQNALKEEGITLHWNAHLPSIEVAFGLPRRSLAMWKPGSTGTTSKYWLNPVDGSVWTGVGTLGTTPSAPFYQINPNRDVISWTYTASTDNVQSILVPYNFGTINIFINGVLQSSEMGHYTVNGRYINLNGALNVGDNLIAYIGQLSLNSTPYVTQSTLNNYAQKTELSGYLTPSKLGEPTGYSLIGAIDSIETLRTIEPISKNQRVLVLSYYTGANVGGGEFYYDSTDTTSLDDGIITFITPNGNRWKRVINGLSLTCYDGGIIPSGGDDSIVLNSFFTKLAELYSSIGKIEMDMLGLKYLSTTGTSVVFDPTKIYLKNFNIKNTLINTTKKFAIVTVKPTLTFQSSVFNVKAQIDNLIISDSTRATGSPVSALLLTSDFNGSFSSVTFNNLVISSPYNGIVFGNHCYLVTFNGGSITSYNNLTDSVTAGLESSIVDMGENYRFNDVTFAGTQVFNWSTIGAEFNFYGVSCDFTRLGINKVSGFILNYIGGHIEYNNTYSNYFESSAVAYVNFSPSWVVSSGNVDYMFYDSSTTKNSLKVKIGILAWNGNTVSSMINTRLIKDECESIQGAMPPVRGDLNKFLVDGAFSQPTIVDGWYADAYVSRTSRLISDTTTLTLGTTSSSSGDVGCLVMTKSSTIGAGFPSGAHLILRVPKGTTPAHVKLKYSSNSNFNIDINVRLVTVISTDSNGVPTFGNRIITSTSTGLSSTANESQYISGTGLFVDSSYIPYEYIQVSISMFAAPAGSILRIYDVLINKIG